MPRARPTERTKKGLNSRSSSDLKRILMNKVLPSFWACCINIPITELMFFTADGNPSFKPNWPRRPMEKRTNQNVNNLWLNVNFS